MKSFVVWKETLIKNAPKKTKPFIVFCSKCFGRKRQGWRGGGGYCRGSCWVPQHFFIKRLASTEPKHVSRLPAQLSASVTERHLSKICSSLWLTWTGIIATCGYNWAGGRRSVGGGMGLNLLAVNTRNHTGPARRTTHAWLHWLRKYCSFLSPKC